VWAKSWYIYIDLGEDSIAPLVRFEGDNAFSLGNPNLVGIGFPNMMDYDAWLSASTSQATNLAFGQPEIADTLRSYPGWAASAAQLDAGGANVWIVTFTLGEQQLAQATVDIANGVVLDFTLYT
jgi:hypothetical protein